MTTTKENGLIVGGSRPFLIDGLTKYKLKLAAEFVSDYSSWKEYLWFGVNEYSSVVQDFIRNNPFIYLDKDKKVVRYII